MRLPDLQLPKCTGGHFLSTGCDGWEGAQATVTRRKLRLQQNLPSHFQNTIKALLCSQSSGKFLELIFAAELSTKVSLRKLRSASWINKKAKLHFPWTFTHNTISCLVHQNLMHIAKASLTPQKPRQPIFKNSHRFNNAKSSDSEVSFFFALDT